MECCYKVFRREIIQSIQIEENRFGFEPEITAKVAKLGCKIYVSLFFYLSLLVIFLIFKEKFDYIQTLLLVSIFALNPYFKDYLLAHQQHPR